MDKFSLKDSGRGDSEAGDSDYEPGRESPMDRLLGEGFTEICAPDGQHRTHAGTPQAPHWAHPTTLHSFPTTFLSSSSELKIKSLSTKYRQMNESSALVLKDALLFY